MMALFFGDGRFVSFKSKLEFDVVDESDDKLMMVLVEDAFFAIFDFFVSFVLDSVSDAKLTGMSRFLFLLLGYS